MMTTAKVNRAAAWAGIGWCALGLLALLIGVTWCMIAERLVRLWLYSDKYIAAELEVTRFHGKPRNSSALCLIEGVIHPGGESVRASDRNIAIKHYDGPDDIAGREPLPAEIEGKRLPVSYWPQQADENRWWHPPTVVTHGTIRGGDVVARNVLFSVAFVAAGLFCVRRGCRNVKASVPLAPRNRRK